MEEGGRGVECVSLSEGVPTWPGNLLASRRRLMRGAREGLWGGEGEGRGCTREPAELLRPTCHEHTGRGGSRWTESSPAPHTPSAAVHLQI